MEKRERKKKRERRREREKERGRKYVLTTMASYDCETAWTNIVVKYFVSLVIFLLLSIQVSPNTNTQYKIHNIQPLTAGIINSGIQNKMKDITFLI